MPVVELKWQYGKGIHWLNHIQRVAERKQVFNEDTDTEDKIFARSS